MTRRTREGRRAERGASLLAAGALLLGASVATTAAAWPDQSSAASMTDEELAQVGSATTEKVCITADSSSADAALRLTASRS